jgi:hypothetical protein
MLRPLATRCWLLAKSLNNMTDSQLPAASSQKLKTNLYFLKPEPLNPGTLNL